MNKSYRLVFILFLIAALILTSCTASHHAGTTYVDRPQLDVDDETAWLNYWEDQFDAYEGNVVAPSTDKYPEAAVSAYQRAKMQWQSKVTEARLQSNLLMYGGGLVAVLLIYLSISSSGTSVR